MTSTFLDIARYWGNELLSYPLLSKRLTDWSHECSLAGVNLVALDIHCITKYFYRHIETKPEEIFRSQKKAGLRQLFQAISIW